jgi:hypothetical protein
VDENEVTPSTSTPLSGEQARRAVRETLLRVRQVLIESDVRPVRATQIFADAHLALAESQRASEATRALHDQLHASVSAYAHVLRTLGVPPERMLVLVKSCVEETTLSTLEPADVRDLMARAVRWGIEGYYAA